jgi:hypothetical protein
MSKIPPSSHQTFIDTPNCVLEYRVQYSTVCIPNVFCDVQLQIINCVGVLSVFCTVIIRCTETFWSPCITRKRQQMKYGLTSRRYRLHKAMARGKIGLCIMLMFSSKHSILWQTNTSPALPYQYGMYTEDSKYVSVHPKLDLPSRRIFETCT